MNKLIKQTVVLLLVAFSIFGCSSDNSSDINNGPSKTLNKSVFFDTFADAEIGVKNREFTFESEQLASSIRFSREGKEEDKAIFSYNYDGLLVFENIEFKDFNETDIEEIRKYTYDNLNRIAKIEFQLNDNNTSETVFTHNQDGTITRNNGLTTSTYFTNEQGIIFKSLINSIEGRETITEVSRETTAEFNGNLITKTTTKTFRNEVLTDTQVISYSYDETIPKLIPNGYILEQFGTINNIFLITDLDIFPIFDYSEKLVSQTITVNTGTNNTERITDYVNTFDADGYLIQTEEFFLDRRISFITYEYN